MIDLHMHTTFSDGSISPEELVAMAVENGVKVIAITDHDNTLSYEAATEAAKGHDLELIPGIEINTHYEGHEVHVLGYYIDMNNEYLQEVCQEHNCQRHVQIKELAQKITKESKASLKFEDIESFSREGGTIGRPHVAKALVKKGIVGNVSEAFRKYLVPNSPTYVKRHTVTPQKRWRPLRTQVAWRLSLTLAICPSLKNWLRT
jgi:3',5'-nucleoside bisphosphate phosphatase